MRPRLLLLLPTATYRARDFLAAAKRLHVDVTVASEEPSTLAALNPAGLLTLDFAKPEGAARVTAAFAARHPIDAVIPVDDQATEAAAAISRALGLRHNSVEAARAARDKSVLRDLLLRAGVPSPRHWNFRFEDDLAAAAREVPYPCVLKPLALSGSRGVIRADGPEGFTAAAARIERILRGPPPAGPPGLSGRFLVEELIPGFEVALEGLVTRGQLEVLALFDKPDPLDGPFFEETIYVTPSRLSAGVQAEIARTASAAARALGLLDGPIHAELRVNERGPWVIEVAGRSIGGLCSRVLRFGTGLSLEELIIRHALGDGAPPPVREAGSAGVLMIPTPRTGFLGETRGLEEARRVPGIEGITITLGRGEELVPLPEGSRYLGFIFARGGSPAEVEAALRESHALIDFAVEARPPLQQNEAASTGPPDGGV
ncbi:MAG TPA: ATP-grasp domain-containing protein [Planctomycetota bacterium]|nr:ATP-grasp domain-containing protein [Planctomycetota bacterium]